MNTIKMIVGLGNYLDQYADTRHNVGHWFINMLSDFYKVSFNFKKKFLGYVSCITLNNNKIYLLRPNLFMNLSGYSVRALSSFYKIDLSEILIVRDELDLIPGIMKIKFGTHHNGHNGVKNILKFLVSKGNFLQLCIGIGRPEQKKNISEFVLKAPNLIEMNMIKKSIFEFILLTKNRIYQKKFLINKTININTE
ncbi:Peptidyl-tRNA hydrolase [Buchnera aphidicola (Cinara cuneomaculata)]|uniref:Peptidyl-tRNA hydrolase n=1 Tax=Buchnera aphidicola (Cinara cuneomaculata) TaxID=1660040 RepID=A0A451CXQ2_9GAMM|nr:aminoacyl-tRNA hydrolase [Buchnera aphidicola]VFP78111.1 Peptidyl-tRNA hydrolase [Buchnera aphidicola (Cinara cuneomaculata)]